MKKIIAYLLSTILYYMGVAVSKVLSKFDDSFFLSMYPIYSWLMSSSVKLDRWGNVDKWDKK
jgi:hypothetical protein